MQHQWLTLLYQLMNSFATESNWNTETRYMFEYCTICLTSLFGMLTEEKHYVTM